MNFTTKKFHVTIFYFRFVIFFVGLFLDIKKEEDLLY